MWIAPHAWIYYAPPEGSSNFREPCVWIEIDQDFCTKSYGVTCDAILSASDPWKCFNTIGTCSRIDQYDHGSLTLRFCLATQVMPRPDYFYPLLVSASISPAKLNPGGGDSDVLATGLRATLSATFADAPSPDRLVDKYADERLLGGAGFGGLTYDPKKKSTFWRKWTTRNLYKVNRPIRYCHGFMDEHGNVTEVFRRNFVITKFDGPTKDGVVTIQGRDALTKADNEKAQAPRASNGKLSSALLAASTAATLVPVGVGAEYPSSGWIKIGSEVLRYTRTGDSLTLDRAQFNTVAVDHSAGEAVQECLRFFAQTAPSIIRRLLVDYALIGPDLIDDHLWQSEAQEYLTRLYSTLITEPVGVSTLLGELCEQMGVVIWFNDRENKVLIRSMRPPDSEPLLSFSENDFRPDSVSLSEMADQQYTRIVINYAPRDYTRAMDDITNFAATDVVGDLDEEGESRNRGVRVKVINSRWLEATDGASSIELGTNLLDFYRLPPKRVSFELDAKDRGVWLGAFASLITSQHVNDIGDTIPLNVQIIEASEKREGFLSFLGQEFNRIAPPSPETRTIDIAADVNNIDLRALHDTKYLTAPSPGDTVIFNFRPGVVIWSNSVSAFAITTGSWPIGVIVKVINSATIVGRGGNGGDANTLVPSATAGYPGGPALEVTFPILLQNLGVIGGGGGGGGGLWAEVYFGGPSPIALVYYSGGGGAGRIAGAAGVISPGSGGLGTGGSLLTGGGGGGGRGVDGWGNPVMALAGAGGDLGRFGDSSDGYSVSGSFVFHRYPGGAPGAAIVGVSNITYIGRTGKIRGPQI